MNPSPSAPGRSSFSADSGNLDLIRAVAVLAVFFAHLDDCLTTVGESLLGWHFAQMGVLIFFVHTSMVLMLSLERMRLDGQGVFGAFYLRRAFRLYPLSMFCVTISMLRGAQAMNLGDRPWTWGEYLSNMALTTNLTSTTNMVGGLWTLPIEAQMYLTLPFLFLLGRSRPVWVLLAAWAVSIPVALAQPAVTSRLNVLGYVPCFLSGVIAWRLSLEATRRFSGRLWLLAFMATWPVFFLTPHDTGRDATMPFRWAFCLLLGLVIPWFGEIPDGRLREVARVVAKYSYGIYLSHIAVMYWTFSLPLPRAAQWAVFLPIAVLVPIAMYHWIEHPLIVIGQKAAKALHRRRAALTHGEVGLSAG